MALTSSGTGSKTAAVDLDQRNKALAQVKLPRVLLYAALPSCVEKGVNMLPLKYALDDAPTEDQVIRRLSSLLDYLRSCRIQLVLPDRYAGLTARSTDEIRAWAFKLSAGGNDCDCLSAAGRCWLGEIRDAFTAAAHRLDEISVTNVRKDAA
jgi:hypothetical protein